jgi:hypothetical protein
VIAAAVRALIAAARRAHQRGGTVESDRLITGAFEGIGWVIKAMPRRPSSWR